MYGVVLFVAMTSAGPSCHCGSGPAICCPERHGCCGTIQFFWGPPAGMGALSEEDARIWNAYLAALTHTERAEVLELWKRADEAGRMKLMGQVKEMQPPDKGREPDREVRNSERTGRRVASNRR